MKLELFLGMKSEDLDRTDLRGIDVNVGGKLKETGTLHWINPNTGATNETGFSALFTIDKRKVYSKQKTLIFSHSA